MVDVGSTPYGKYNYDEEDPYSDAHCFFSSGLAQNRYNTTQAVPLTGGMMGVGFDLSKPSAGRAGRF